MKYQALYICGSDGVGKSTIIQECSKVLQQRGFKTESVWMRYNHYTTKAVNGLGRLLGLSYYETLSDGSKIGYHDYWRSRLLSWIFVITTAFDLTIAVRLKAQRRDSFLIVDRHAYDILVDLMVDTRLPLMNSWVERYLVSHLPERCCTVCLSLPYKEIVRRRSILTEDRTVKERLGYYKRISDERDGVWELSNTESVTEVVNKIVSILEGGG